MVDYKKGLLSGIVAAIVMLVLGFIFMIPFPEYSAWYMEAFAGMNMTMMWISTFLLGLFMGIFYSVVGSTIPGKGYMKGINYGIMVWLLAGIMWPVMSIGWAPMSVTVIDFVTGAIMFALSGAALVAVYDKLK
jgi:hypothetical protein